MGNNKKNKEQVIEAGAKLNSRTKKIIAVCILVVVFVCAGLLIFFHPWSQSSDTATTQTTSVSETATATDGNGTSNNGANNDSAADNKTGSKKTIPTSDFFITSSGFDGNELYANGMISNIQEEGGICYLHATGPNGEERTAKADATWDNKNVQCGDLSISKDQLTDGTWKIYVEYVSDNYTGKSDTYSVDVNM